MHINEMNTVSCTVPAEDVTRVKGLGCLREKNSKTFLVILHDLFMAVRYADDILVLDRGRLCFAGTVESCLEQRILEETFQLKQYSIEENGEKRIFFSGE